MIKRREVMGRKKLCLVIPSLQAGGMERVMSELAGYFATKENLEIHLVLYGITREQFYEIPASIIVHKPGFRFNNNLRFFNTAKTLLYLRKTIRKLNPDSILSFGEYWNTFVLFAFFGLKNPVYISDRCQPDKSLGKVHDWLRERMYPRATGIVAQTVKSKEIYLSQLSHNNIDVIGNPIRDITTDKEITRENIVLTVGRLIKTKHHDKLVEIFLKIKKQGWKLVIVGYDHLKQNNYDRIKEIIDNNNAAETVILAGKQKEIDSFYLRSRIFAFTSSSEGFPNVIGEAMSSGLPVIAFDCVAGPAEMIRDNKNGFLVPLFDYNKFSNGLEQLMDSEELRTRFGKQAREDIRQFSIEKIGEKYLNFILA